MEKNGFDELCSRCGMRNDAHYGGGQFCLWGGDGEITFSGSGEYRGIEWFEEYPIFKTIRALDISPETKVYALRAARRIIDNDESPGNDYKSPDISMFCPWRGTKEGFEWWENLNLGKDPGVPTEIGKIIHDALSRSEGLGYVYGVADQDMKKGDIGNIQIGGRAIIFGGISAKPDLRKDRIARVSGLIKLE